MRWKMSTGDSGIGGVVPYDNDPDTYLKDLTAWQHWAGFVRSDGSGGWERQLFMNGANFTSVSSCSSYTGSGNIRFGEGSLGNSYVFFDNIIFFAGRSLPASEIEDLYYQDEDWFRIDTSNFANLALLYRFHIQPDWPHSSSPGYGQGIGVGLFSTWTTTMPDLSGQGNDGMVAGTAGEWYIQSTQSGRLGQAARHGSGGKLDRWGGISVLGCLCKCGYVPNSTAGPQPCIACESGLYKQKWGTASCQECAAGKYSAAPAACTCPTCPPNSSTSASGQSACLCNAGHTGPDGGPCNACVPGTYKQAVGSEICALCAGGKYSTG